MPAGEKRVKAKSATTAAPRKRAKQASPDLPPLSDVGDMFADMVSKQPQLAGVAKALGGRRLRVATMCSGTESPLLALDLISRAMKEQYNAGLDVEHVFSCEIEPFKQAYIERNFSPPVIFRDVCELGGAEATTVYGSKVKVPGNVDLLVAGTSCVDFSSLNNKKKALDAQGQSGRTFRGMLDWVARTRPRIVVLENIRNAPWETVVEKFAAIRYSAKAVHLDTKNYYLPQTRERGYLVAVDEHASPLPGKWAERVREMERPASATLDDFLLRSDDPRVVGATAKLVRDSEGRSRAPADWGRCENRHQRTRAEEHLGNRRPLTAWEAGGTCKLPDFANTPWGGLQVERVWDLMDILVLQFAYKGIDPSYKTLIWNLSQNVDRNVGSSRMGICPCLTPSMIPYATIRGGPMTGLEAISLQGLPVNNILFTRETEDNLYDLAGNAMSTTVVGSCMVAALTVAGHLLEAESAGVLDVDMSEQPADMRIAGEDRLVRRAVDLSASDVPLSLLLEHAHRSRRLCVCEGRDAISSRPLQECRSCGSTSCTVCGGRPEHNYEHIDLSALRRLSPGDFMTELKAALPMCITLSGAQEALSALTDTGELVEAWQQALRDAASSDLRFSDIQRQQVWTARFESPAARLELVLSSSRAEWWLFGKPKRDVPVGSPLRAVLEQPIARFRCIGALFEGSWELAVPTPRRFTLQMTGTGSLIDSWQRQLGLQRDDVKEKMVWSTLEVSIPEDANLLDVDVAGVYKLHSRCGTACNSLHRREQEGGPDMFLFLDPSRTGDAAQDSFVFSTSHRRLEYGEARRVVASLDPAWRQNHHDGAQEVDCVVPCRWIPAPAFQHTPSTAQATVLVPPMTLAFDASITGCDTASAILVCRIPNTSGAGLWREGEWTVVDKVHERSTFQSLSWCLDRASRLCEASDGWVEVPLSAGHECTRCAPHPPTIDWRRVGKFMKGFVDPGQAGRFERALKQRPTAFVTQLLFESNEGGVGVVRISLNPMSLVHRAAACLPSTAGTTSFAYSLDTNFVPMSHLEPPNFSLKSNRSDRPHSQPPNFEPGRKLRPEQLRSLTWMVEAETTGRTFLEEEVAEAVLEPLGWRLQGRAQHSHTVYGGVLADAVGYGKTAITLGLIDCRSSTTATAAPLVQDVHGAIRVKTTLVIVPSHLTRQWSSEIEKFIGKKRYKHQVVSTVTQLNKLTIEAISKLDILVVASSLFNSEVYLRNLQDFSAGGPLPPKEGRHVLQRLDEIASTRAEQVERIKANNLEGALTALRTAKQSALKSEQWAERCETDASATPLTVADTSEMDEDVPPPPRGKKRPSTSKSANVDEDDLEDEKPVKKKAKKKSTTTPTPERMEQKLEAAAEKGDWQSLTAPLLEVFQFNRIVVDEYTYIKDKALHMITRLKSTYRWVLSGTPPVHDFAAVRSIATHLGIHLGIDDDGDYVSSTKKSQRTDVQRFHAFREARTHEWHAHRQQVAQAFLDQCVRQNVAEIDEIPSETHIVKVQLPAAERAIYLELQHLLEGQDMVIRRRKKSESDREKRLAVVMGDSGSADEALLKRAATFDLDEVSTDSAMTVCERIVQARADQRDECLSDMKAKMLIARGMRSQIEGTSERYLKEFLETLQKKGFGDSDADELARQCWAEVEAGPISEPSAGTSKPKEGEDNEEAEDDNGADDDDAADDDAASEADTTAVASCAAKAATDNAEPALKKADAPEKSQEDLIWDLREHTHEMRRVMKELTGRVRSHRYFKAVRDVQRAGAALSIDCPNCEARGIGRADAAILSSCGHMGCRQCVHKCAAKEECVLASEKLCRSVARTSNIVHAATLGADDPAAHVGQHFGRKLETIVDYIKNNPEIRPEDRILIFVQYEDLMKRVAAALVANDIKTCEIKGSPPQRSKTLETFQTSTDERVLLLDILDESASGANLTCANHAIFVAPLLVRTQQMYDASETQAVGRLRRYGQMNKVHIWRFLTLDTKDIEIYEDRTKKKVK